MPTGQPNTNNPSLTLSSCLKLIKGSHQIPVFHRLPLRTWVNSSNPLGVSGPYDLLWPRKSELCGSMFHSLGLQRLCSFMPSYSWATIGHTERRVSNSTRATDLQVTPLSTHGLQALLTDKTSERWGQKKSYLSEPHHPNHLNKELSK